jgi:hypothetical protein
MKELFPYARTTAYEPKWLHGTGMRRRRKQLGVLRSKTGDHVGFFASTVSFRTMSNKNLGRNASYGNVRYPLTQRRL